MNRGNLACLPASGVEAILPSAPLLDETNAPSGIEQDSRRVVTRVPTHVHLRTRTSVHAPTRYPLSRYHDIMWLMI